MWQQVRQRIRHEEHAHANDPKIAEPQWHLSWLYATTGAIVGWGQIWVLDACYASPLRPVFSSAPRRSGAQRITSICRHRGLQRQNVKLSRDACFNSAIQAFRAARSSFFSARSVSDWVFAAYRSLPIQMISLLSPILLSLVLLVQCLSAQSVVVISANPQSSSLTSSSLASLSSSASSFTTSGSRNATTSSTIYLRSSTTEDVTAIAGLPTSAARNSGSASATTSARPRPSNTRPCNGYPEFCNRRFSNITMVVAHNSPFVKEHNAASNQILPVLTQLNDGIRGCK